jgi:hypothetical protein
MAQHSDSTKDLVVAKIDRVVLRSNTALEYFALALPEFRTTSDYARRNVNTGFFLAPYGRARQMVNHRTKTQLFVQYYPRFRRLASLRVAIVPDDRRGLKRKELEKITAALSPFHFLVIEIALDFRSVTK